MSPTAYDTVPRSGRGDQSTRLWQEGYTYISSRCDALDTDVFRTRLLLKPVFCVRGSSAAELFYGSDGLLTRTGAMPAFAQHLLQDEHSVQDLDGEAHRERKRLFLPMLEPTAADDLRAQVDRAWHEHVASWPPGHRAVLYPTMNRVLTAAALRWVGLPASGREVDTRCAQLTTMIDNAASFGARNWYARLSRRRAEAWAAQVIEAIRDARLTPDPSAMAAAIAAFEQDRMRLPSQVAAVELLNVLRPVVAVARFVVFAAVALWRFPQWKERIASDDTQVRPFVEETRRYFPFFPAIGGRATESFTWRGHVFPASSWLLLDLYGTNHDPRIWASPDAFSPDRFTAQKHRVYDVVAQGGGEYATSHRCPGEHVTVAAVEQMVRILATADYRVPAQDLTIALTRMPALPRSGFVLGVEAGSFSD